MSARFTDWAKAREEAVILANKHGLDVAIQAVKEFGKLGYNVSFAHNMDSDYARAEIVRPSESA